MKFGGTVASLFLTLAAFGGSVGATYAAEALHYPAKHIVTLTSQEIARLGVETAPAQRATFTPEVHGYGVVSSLATVAQTDSDIRTALAAVADSQAALDRATKLMALNAVSMQAFYTSQHQAAADKAQLDLADRKEIATFGFHAPWRGPPRNDAIISALTSGNSELIIATFPLGIAFASPPSSLVITRLDPQPGQKSWISKATWDAPADPSIPGRSFFALVDNSELAQGEHVLIFAPTGAPIDGVRVPSDAVILSEDKPWCYVAVSDQRFQRVEIDLRLQISGGYFVAKGIAPHQPVVVKGTGLLLARELGAATPGQD